VYPDLYLEIASLRGQDVRDQAAQERLRHQAAQCDEKVPADPGREAAYRRLAIAILGLDRSRLIAGNRVVL
jgi:hypothetical protein